MVNRSRAFVCASFLLLAGCSSNGGFLGTGYLPKGDLTLTSTTTGNVITTSPSSPLVITSQAFSVGIQETNFSGPYKVTMTSWSSNFNVPCFEPHLTDTSDHINVVTFSADNANGMNPNPCTFNGSDQESALFSDNKGHTISLYWVLD